MYRLGGMTVSAMFAIVLASQSVNACALGVIESYAVDHPEKLTATQLSGRYIFRARFLAVGALPAMHPDLTSFIADVIVIKTFGLRMVEREDISYNRLRCGYTPKAGVEMTLEAERGPDGNLWLKVYRTGW